MIISLMQCKPMRLRRMVEKIALERVSPRAGHYGFLDLCEVREGSMERLYELILNGRHLFVTDNLQTADPFRVLGAINPKSEFVHVKMDGLGFASHEDRASWHRYMFDARVKVDVKTDKMYERFVRKDQQIFAFYGKEVLIRKEEVFLTALNEFFRVFGVACLKQRFIEQHHDEGKGGTTDD